MVVFSGIGKKRGMQALGLPEDFSKGLSISSYVNVTLRLQDPGTSGEQRLAALKGPTGRLLAQLVAAAE